MSDLSFDFKNKTEKILLNEETAQDDSFLALVLDTVPMDAVIRDDETGFSAEVSPRTIQWLIDEVKRLSALIDGK